MLRQFYRQHIGALTFSGGAHRLNVNDASGVTFNSGSVFTQGTGFAGNAFLVPAQPVRSYLQVVLLVV